MNPNINSIGVFEISNLSLKETEEIFDCSCQCIEEIICNLIRPYFQQNTQENPSVSLTERKIEQRSKMEDDAVQIFISKNEIEEALEFIYKFCIETCASPQLFKSEINKFLKLNLTCEQIDRAAAWLEAESLSTYFHNTSSFDSIGIDFNSSYFGSLYEAYIRINEFQKAEKIKDWMLS